MKKSRFFLLASVISIYLFSCGPDHSEKSAGIQTSPPSFDKQWATSFIDSVNEIISEQFSKGDSAGLASHYWPDAELLLSNSEAIKGNDILPALGAMTRMGIKEFTFSTTDIKGDSEFMIETGTYEMKDEKKTIADKGKYVVVWQQRNGEWKLYRDIGNTSLPASK